MTMDGEEEGDSPIIAQLNGQNYCYWSYVLKNFLKGKRMWGYVTGSVVKPTSVKEMESWDANNSKIITWIHSSVERSIGIGLSGYDTAKEVWDHLERLYAQSNFAKQYELEIDIRALDHHNQNNMTIQELYSAMRNLWDQLSLTESAELRSFAPYVARREEQRLVQFLMALGDDFQGIRGSILHRNPLPRVDSVVNELLAEEVRLKSSQSQKSQKRNIKFKGSVDRLSMLTDDLLGLILSSLTTKEAMATSILSRRWKYLWTLTRKLDFDGRECLRRASANEVSNSVRNNEISKFVKWVDQVIAVASASTSTSLEEFRVYFDLDMNHTKHIDEWLNFALSRKVERLVLNLTDRWELGYPERKECYSFPYKKGNFPNELKLIKKLSTHCVNVSGEAAQLFLANCPLLEQLSLSYSDDLKSLQVVGTSPSFKCLEISSCHNLNSVLIRDSNVVTFKYKGRNKMQHFELTNVPMLTQVWIGGAFTYRKDNVFEMFSGVLPQLQMFKIYVSPSTALRWHETNKYNLSAVRMPNLKELVVNIRGYYKDKESLIPLVHLIDASPSLQRFVLEAPHIHSKHEHLFKNSCDINKIHVHKAYPQLKEVEFVGYRGVNSQSELIMHFVENGIALQNIVVDLRCFKVEFDRPWDLISEPKIEEEKSARTYADQLKDYVPRRINVKIL